MLLYFRKDGDEMSKICCLTGHRHFSAIDVKKLYVRLKNVLTDLIVKEGFTDFRTGGAMGFDTLAALCILELKMKYPQIKLHVFVPCENQEKYFPRIDKKVYRTVLERADATTLVNKQYSPGVMFARNRAMVKGSDVCVAFMSRRAGGTKYTVDYAEKAGVKVIHLFDRSLIRVK